MLGNWLSNFSDKERRVMLVGAAALCWAIWRCRNNIIFNKTKYSPFIQAIFKGGPTGCAYGCAFGDRRLGNSQSGVEA